VGAQAECQWNVLYLSATDRASHTAAHRGQASRLTSQFGELMVRHELQVDEACPKGTPLPGAGSWLGSNKSSPSYPSPAAA